MKECESRVGTYVPWSMGERFKCVTCGQHVRQSHTVQPLCRDKGIYDVVYPIPQHTVKEVAND